MPVAASVTVMAVMTAMTVIVAVKLAGAGISGDDDDYGDNVNAKYGGDTETRDVDFATLLLETRQGQRH